MASLQIYDPFADTAVDTLFRHLLRTDRNDRTAAPQGIRVDVAENDKGYVVYAEIPGVAKDEIHVAIEGNQVTIAADVKPRVAGAEGTRVLRAERYAGNVYRSFTLPLELDETASEAKYENGVLELQLVKKPAVAGRKLTVQ
ncbi:MAG: Hsp20/alpha crystallin family protein [Betaproteobacteria bacterium]